jgi:2-oxoglutarate dehydrogenase E1 component
MLDEMIQLSAAHGGARWSSAWPTAGAQRAGPQPRPAVRDDLRGVRGRLDARGDHHHPAGRTGDVKYHHGAQGSYELADGESIIVRLESNPSHLEYVSPVVIGATRSLQTSRQGPHAHLDTDAAIPDRHPR